MANRIPLIVNAGAGQIQELPLGDNFDIGGGEIVNVSGITTPTVSVTGNVSASYFIGDGGGLSNIPGTNYSNSNVGSYLQTYGGNILVNNLTGVGQLFAPVITATGNVTGSYFLGNGSQLTGIPAGYTNANAASFLASLGSNSISTTGTLAVGLVAGDLIPDGNVTRSLGNVTNQWKSLYVSNNTIYINNIPLSIISGNILTVNGANAITAAANGLLNVSTFTTTGNIVSTAFVGNGAGLTDIDANAIVGDIGNADSNVAGNVITANTANLSVANVSSLTGVTTANIATANIPSLTGVTTANIATANITSVTASTYLGNAAGLASITGANVTGNVPSATIANTVTNPAQPNITSVGTLSSVSVSGELSAGSGTNSLVVSGNVISSVGTTITIDPDSANGGITGNVIVTGNLQILGNLNYLDVSTALTSNLVWQAANNASTAPDAHGGGLAVGPAGSPYASLLYSQTSNTWIASINVQSNGNLTALGNVVGNIVVANIFTGEGGNISNIKAANVVGTVSTANTVTDNAQPNITSVGTLTSLSVTGNITGSYVIGNGSQLTGLPAGYSNANAAAFLASGNSTPISVTGNVSGNNISATGVVITEAGFVLNPTVIANSFTVPSGYNASAAGPITFAAGVTVTVPAGSSLVIN